ncbi:MAG: hypothetical protein ACP5KU_07925, partial [Candidatus Bathyarchaeia archaeon]
MEIPQKPKTTFSTAIILAIIVVSLFAGGVVGYLFGYSHEISDLQNQLSNLQEQMSSLQSAQNVTNQNNTYILAGNTSLSKLYEQVRDSVVTIRGVIVQYNLWNVPYYTQVQGSGFVY